MIFVVLGTHEMQFTRLLDEIDKLKNQGKLEEDVVVQSGHTDYDSEHMTIIPYMSYEDMNNYFKEANFVISHAGTGSVTTALKLGKKVIAAPRLHKYKEHNDDHQVELAQVFADAGHLLVWDDKESLHSVIKEIEIFEPTPFVSKTDNIIGLLEGFIKEI